MAKKQIEKFRAGKSEHFRALAQRDSAFVMPLHDSSFEYFAAEARVVAAKHRGGKLRHFNCDLRAHDWNLSESKSLVKAGNDNVP